MIDNFLEIDNFLGIDTDVGVKILSFFKGQVKSPVLHNTRDGSEFYVPYLSHYM